eukprot:TRINITY_DN9928_c0_g1_i2.p1 TRINITY_DN9928_c0_g1~~TRINITY_DN9928_c0_g1_i2.p1  ORF type:complete len:582 (+),score=136.07 TRINITY_DN9928_c0_g1_i2:100-1845(+)
MSLLALPEEIVLHLLFYLDVPDVVRCSSLCHRLHRVCSSQSLWRFKCLQRWKRWREKEWDIACCASTLASSELRKKHRIEWRERYVKRHQEEKEYRGLLLGLGDVPSKKEECKRRLEDISVEIIPWIERVLEQCEYQYPLGGPLALVYHGRAWRSRVADERIAAVLLRLGGREEHRPSLEECACALSERADPDTSRARLSAQLHSIADQARHALHDIPQAHILDRIRALMEFLFSKNGLGFSGDVQRYGHIKHCYLHECLESKKSIPITLCLLFKCVADRLGLHVRGFNAPGHFLLTGCDENDTPFFVDAFHCRLMNRAEMVQFFHDLANVTASSLPSDDDTCTVTDWCRRMIANMLQRTHTNERDEQMSLALQLLLLPGSSRQVWLRFLHQLITGDHIDYALFAASLLMKADGESEPAAVLSQFHQLARRNGGDREEKRRPTDGSVKFRVGQVIRHKQYHYSGVITGWDGECKASNAWAGTMGVQRMQRGMQQPFYHVQPDERQRSGATYVAEDNIEVVEAGEEPSPVMVQDIGCYFVRFLPLLNRYEPCASIRAAYPEDLDDISLEEDNGTTDPTPWTG